MYVLLIVYDVTRRETFTNLMDVWAKEVEMYLTNHECIKILVGNKVDRVSCMILPSFKPQTLHFKESLISTG